MPVIDELYIRNGTNRVPVDSINNKTIEEIVVGGQPHHFAKQKDVAGVDSVVCDNAVNEPFRTIEATGNTTQDGTATPEAPVDIVNAGDNGVEVELSGANLFDIDTVLGNMSNVTQSSSGIWVIGNIGLVYNKVLFTNVLEKQGMLTLRVRQRTRISNPSENYLAYAIYYTDGTRYALAGKGINEFTDYIYTTNANKTVKDIKFSYYGSATTEIESIMINWGEPLPYQPYTEPQTITIPSEVTLADGTIVPLRMGEGDTLTVNGITKKVTYIEKGWQEDISTRTFIDRTTSTLTEGRRWFQPNASNIPLSIVGKGYCNILGKTDNTLGDYNHFRVGQYQNAMTLGIFTTGFNSLDEFNTWKETNPIIVRLQRVTPLEYDLTDTDLGQQLLALAANKGTNILEITGATSLGVSYWRQVLPDEEI